MGTVPSLGHSRVVVKFKAVKKIIKEKPDRIYIKFTVISIYQWNQLPTHHPVQFFLYLQMCWYQTNGEEDERCLKEGGNERQMRRCVRVKKQKKEQHVCICLVFPSTSLFIILCLLRLFKGALLLCHFLAGTSFFFSRCRSLWPRQEGWRVTTPSPPAALVFITLYTLNIAHFVHAGRRGASVYKWFSVCMHVCIKECYKTWARLTVSSRHLKGSCSARAGPLRK